MVNYIKHIYNTSKIKYVFITLSYRNLVKKLMFNLKKMSNKIFFTHKKYLIFINALIYLLTKFIIHGNNNIN